MIGKIIRKFLVSIAVISAVFVSTDCKKQARCGCGKDVLNSLVSASSYIYYTADKAIITSAVVGDQLSYYTFCNPTEMSTKLGDAKYGDIMLVSGDVFWDCNFVYQSSNSSYQYSMVKQYQIQVTDLSFDLYGKKSGESVK